ncbi:MAG TPA: methyltransferase domain-containing protein, partial [Pseudonocardia sp.]|nr:methyltransferase domain-containing protein [Pseudonocardia sp.]
SGPARPSPPSSAGPEPSCGCRPSAWGPAGAYDVVMCRHVLAHNGGRERAIVAHLASLARPGGALYLVDVDAAGLWTRPGDPDLADLQERYLQWHRRRGNDLSVGRMLGLLLEEVGATVEVFRTGGPVSRVPAGLRPPPWAARDALRDAGLADDADVARWDAAFRRTDARWPRPWAAMPVCVAVGRLP